MRRLWMMFACCCLLAGVVTAQDASLVPQDTTLTTQTDLYGQQVPYAKGTLANQGDQAYSDVSLQATAFDAKNKAIGEGVGYLVDACGAGLLPDFALQPGTAQPFAIPLELDEDGLTIDHVDVNAQGTPTDAAPRIAPLLVKGVTQAFEGEVVGVEWMDEDHLRFGVGCWRDLFLKWEWHEYNLKTEVQQPAENPNTAHVTDALRQQLGLTDDPYFAHSMLSFPPDARRIVYQNEGNSFYSAEPDGSFKRLMLDHLFNRTLQGITWLKKGAFLAYYYGAFGDPVYYFTGNVEGKIFSERPENNPTSLIAPGATPDGSRIVFAAEQDGKTGYYLKRAAYPGADLLFEADVPGNNWPGPLVEEDADGTTFIYAALPVGDAAHLECFNLKTKELHDLSPLPLNLSSEERGWWSLSPESNTIALAANGLNGGLWLIDLGALPACE